MTTSKVGIFNFVDWRGGPPVIVQEQGVTFHRPGVDGVGQQTIGRWEEPFTRTLVHWESSFARALYNLTIMKQLPRTGPVFVFYEGINYSLAPYRHKYLVDHVREVSCNTLVRQFGPNVNTTGGAELVVEITMTPHALY